MKIKGFTLIELLVTVTIIGILSSITIVGLNSMREKAQDTAHLSGIRDLQLALEAYKSINGKYPEAGSDKDYIKDLAPGYMNNLPTDGGTNSYSYAVDTEDYKSYCVAVKGRIFKPDAQPDLKNSECAAKSWVSCKGPKTTPLLSACK